MQMRPSLTTPRAHREPPAWRPTWEFEKPPPENVSIGRHNSIWIMSGGPLRKSRPLWWI